MKPLGRYIVTRCDWDGIAVVLGDWRFWSDHERELAEWCQAHCAHWQGMTVRMTEEALTLFALKWAA